MKVLFKYVYPDSVDSQTSLPCLAWRPALQRGESHILDPILAISWGHQVQLYQVRNFEKFKTTKSNKFH
jgi:hypothetical protein